MCAPTDRSAVGVKLKFPEGSAVTRATSTPSTKMITVELAGAVPLMTGRKPVVEPLAGVTTTGAATLAGKAPGRMVTIPGLPGAAPYVSPPGALAVGCVPAKPPVTTGMHPTVTP
ncbi:hypothetical protein MYXA107069_37940 [Myxococcus xanthus]